MVLTAHEKDKGKVMNDLQMQEQPKEGQLAEVQCIWNSKGTFIIKDDGEIMDSEFEDKNAPPVTVSKFMSEACLRLDRILVRGGKNKDLGEQNQKVMQEMIDIDLEQYQLKKVGEMGK